MGFIRVKTMFFDLDNTLIDIVWASHRDMTEIIKLLQSNTIIKKKLESSVIKFKLNWAKNAFILTPL